MATRTLAARWPKGIWHPITRAVIATAIANFDMRLFMSFLHGYRSMIDIVSLHRRDFDLMG
jgi:hypothetical protein